MDNGTKEERSRCEGEGKKKSGEEKGEERGRGGRDFDEILSGEERGSNGLAKGNRKGEKDINERSKKKNKK